MHAEQYASEAVSYLVANAMDHKTENYHLEAACGKSNSILKFLNLKRFSVFASERAWHCCDETIQVMGGMGYMFEQGPRFKMIIYCYCQLKFFEHKKASRK